MISHTCLMAPDLSPVLLMVTVFDCVAGLAGAALAMDAGTATPATENRPTPHATAVRSRRWPVRDIVMLKTLVAHPDRVNTQKQRDMNRQVNNSQPVTPRIRSDHDPDSLSIGSIQTAPSTVRRMLPVAGLAGTGRVAPEHLGHTTVRQPHERGRISVAPMHDVGQADGRRLLQHEIPLLQLTALGLHGQIFNERFTHFVGEA